MKALGIATVVCLLLSLVFAGLAFTSPVKSQPPAPASEVTNSCGQLQNATQRQVQLCWNKMQSDLYIAELAYTPKESTFMAYTQDFQAGEGFVILTLLLALVLVVGVPDFLKRKLSLPRPARLVLMSAVVVGFGTFVFMESFNILNANAGNQVWVFKHLFEKVPGGSETAVFGLLVACVCLGALEMKGGIHAGIESGVILGSASAFVAQMFLWALDDKEMYKHVTGWITWSWDGVCLVGNWPVLIVAGGLALLYAFPFVARFLAAKEIAREDRILSRMGVGP